LEPITLVAAAINHPHVLFRAPLAPPADDPGNATIDQIEIEGGGAAARLLAAATASGMRRSASTRTGAGGRIGNGPTAARNARAGHPREIREKFNLWEYHGVPSLWSLGRPAGARRSPGLSVAARRG